MASFGRFQEPGSGTSGEFFERGVAGLGNLVFFWGGTRFVKQVRNQFWNQVLGMRF